ncbi:flavin reductase family protein [Lentzea flaviverrucosa]|uniref:NADH-FMN oxidoreductase RutF, flavin reductase (DIM6/NTAB) family n=1 Tax=Lentzea flaviverrucosa TaxID=200379 RepID=A0A1H9SF27_9PSEU|nr:flavin reductase family protein [Lentzea flaviverrucosa]RDI25346.1 flavin reductase (DIM6/NTAB) family NADH-FMN oxidoreductase RutF [Lentzea flaviverrucosa]SER83567.1 NADH-FMN oxidoreductase RutF, flavin reductase (DIM6/NTAB) family [Lentzea flaviverrucosa]
MSESLLPAVTPDDDVAEEFRTMMRGFPTGVAVVTALDTTGRPWGMTCSSICSVTLDPPTLLLCVRSGSPTLAAMRGRGAFTVNLLHEGARDTAALFASGDPDRFDRVEWGFGGGGPHLKADAHAVADCVIARPPVEAGDHVVVFGAVERVALVTGDPPLLYGHRQYRAWSAAS